MIRDLELRRVKIKSNKAGKCSMQVKLNMIFFVLFIYPPSWYMVEAELIEGTLIVLDL